MHEGDFLEACDGGGHIVQAVVGAAANAKRATVIATSDVQKASMFLFKLPVQPWMELVSIGLKVRYRLSIKCGLYNVWKQSPAMSQVAWDGPKWEVVVALGSLKGGRAETLVEKISELGAWSLQPLLTSRSPSIGESTKEHSCHSV